MKYSNEISLILACARIDADPDAVAQKIKKAGFDWDMFIRVCIRHKVLPLVFNGLLKNHKDDIPESVKTNVETYLFENSVNNYALIEKLFLVLEQFERNGIQALPFKGPVLARVLFDDISLRRYLDLDILIPQKDAFRALEVLEELGCKPDTPLPEGNKRFVYIKNLPGINMIWSEKELSIDLQWDIANRYTYTPIKLDHFENRLETVLVDQRALPSLPAEEYLCYLCVHGTKHRWQILDGVCCVSELIRVRSDMDWEYVWAYAEKLHCKTSLLLGLYLAEYLLNAELPGFIIQEFKTNENIEILATQACEGMFTDYMETRDVSEKFDSFILKTQDGLPDKIRYCMVLLFMPTKEDLRVFPLPWSFFWHLHMLRPVRLAFEFFKRKF